MAVEIAVYGVESVFTPEVVETARRCGRPVSLYVIAGEPEWNMQGVQAVSSAAVAAELLELPYVVPWVTPGLRHAKCLDAESKGFRNPVTLIDPGAVIASNSDVGSGVYVNAGATVGAYASLGYFSLINRNASFGHHSICEPFSSIGPGATIAARCRIGKGTMVGAGAVVAPGINIGDNCLVAVGAVVAKDLPDNCLAAGNPARVLQTGIAGYKGFTVA